MNDEINEALGNYEVVMGSPLGAKAVNAERRAFVERVTSLLVAAREEGRRAGLEEAARRVRMFTPRPESPKEFENVADAIVFLVSNPLVVSEPRGKARQDERLPCGCRQADGCEDML